MVSNEQAVTAIVETCAALSDGNVSQAAEIIRTKYPHDPNDKPSKTTKRFTKKTHTVTTYNLKKNITNADRIEIFMRDGFIDRYSGERLLFPGVVHVLTQLLPEVFPYHSNGKEIVCHQIWWNLTASTNRKIPPSLGGGSDYDNWVCTAARKSTIKGASTPDELGWKLYPSGKLEDWDGLTAWFMSYVDAHPKILEDNKDIGGWYDALKKFLNKHGGILHGRH